MAHSLLKKDTTRPIEAHRPSLSRDELESVLDCLIQDRLGSGELSLKFEKAFSQAFGFKYSVSVNSLTAAYHLAFLGLGVTSTHRIFMSAIAPVAAFDAANYTGAEVILVDPEKGSFHPSSAKVLEKVSVTEGPAVFILEHTFGAVWNFSELAEIKARNVQIIEDFTGLLGSTSEEGTSFGQVGDVSICGMSERDLITTGNGAMIVSADSKLHQKIRSLRYGQKREALSTAYDYRLWDFQAALGFDQISRFALTLARRKKIGIKYLETLRQTKHESYFKNPTVDAYSKFPVLISKNMEEVLRYFSSLHIGVSRAVETPLHHLDGSDRMEYPNAERFYQRAVSIPVYPALTANNVERIAQSLRGLI